MAVNIPTKGAVMANTSISKKIMALSPHIEMVVRRLYWANVGWLSKRVIKKNTSTPLVSAVDYQKIENFLVAQGAKPGRLLLVHSAYAPFKGRGKTPNQIVDFLLDLVGSQGTLAMPAMPKFDNSVDTRDYLKQDVLDQVYLYDVQKSGIKTGVLPLMLSKRFESVRSEHPINTMVALGPLANELMKDNLVGESPLACGPNSSWKKCLDNDALIIGLGTDLTHSLTSIHIAEDVQDKDWPVKDWYIDKKFKIINGENETNIQLRERAPKWGALHFGERTLAKDLIDSGLLKSTVIDGILIETLNAKDLNIHLNNRNSCGYPYFWV